MYDNDSYFSSNSVDDELYYFTKEQLLIHYMDFALKIVSIFLSKVTLKFSEPNDYLSTYHLAFEKAYATYDKNRASFATYLKHILVMELYKDIGQELKNNYVLHSAISFDDNILLSESLDILGSVIDLHSNDPRFEIDSDTTHLVLSDSDVKAVQKGEYDKIQFRNAVLVYRYFGYKLEEITKALHTTIGKVRYVIKRYEVKLK